MLERRADPLLTLSLGGTLLGAAFVAFAHALPFVVVLLVASALAGLAARIEHITITLPPAPVERRALEPPATDPPLA